MEQDKETFATELIRMVKMSARRWFIIAMVELCIIAILLVFLFVFPIKTISEIEYAQDVEDVEDSDITQNIGDSYGYSETEGN